MVTALILRTVTGELTEPQCIRTNQKFHHKFSVFECMKIAQIMLKYPYLCLTLVPIVTQSQLGYMTTQCTSLHTNRSNCLHYFLLSENVLNYKNGTKMFYVACRTLLVMLCVGKYYFVDLNGMARLPNSATKYMCFAKLGKILFFKTKHF